MLIDSDFIDITQSLSSNVVAKNIVLKNKWGMEVMDAALAYLIGALGATGIFRAALFLLSGYMENLQSSRRCRQATCHPKLFRVGN